MHKSSFTVMNARKQDKYKTIDQHFYCYTAQKKKN